MLLWRKIVDWLVSFPGRQLQTLGLIIQSDYQPKVLVFDETQQSAIFLHDYIEHVHLID